MTILFKAFLVISFIGSITCYEGVAMDNYADSAPPVKLKKKNDEILRVRDLYPSSEATSLELENKNICYLSETMNTWVNKKNIYLNDNQIKFIPPCIQKCKFVQILDLTNNKLKNLPREIAEVGCNVMFPLNTTIYLHGNPIKSLPKALFEAMKTRHIILNIDKSMLEKAVLPHIDIMLIHVLNRRDAKILNEQGMMLFFDKNNSPGWKYASSFF